MEDSCKTQYKKMFLDQFLFLKYCIYSTIHRLITKGIPNNLVHKKLFYVLNLITYNDEPKPEYAP